MGIGPRQDRAEGSWVTRRNMRINYTFKIKLKFVFNNGVFQVQVNSIPFHFFTLCFPLIAHAPFLAFLRMKGTNYIPCPRQRKHGVNHCKHLRKMELFLLLQSWVGKKKQEVWRDLARIK